MRSRRCFALMEIFFTCFNCFELRFPKISNCRRSENPIMEFNGVLSSCLMLTIKSVFIFLATSDSIFVVFSLPIATQYKESILSLLGIIAGAVVALSSTTFIANSMPGIMLRIIKPFRIGDYIESENIFGRVTDIHVLHTEIQSVDRDLVTFPNLKLVSNI